MELAVSLAPIVFVGLELEVDGFGKSYLSYFTTMCRYPLISCAAIASDSKLVYDVSAKRDQPRE